ncbi:hypothetical protein BTIS_1193 [Bifidobacterium tissieri]|uniref:Uncharacterized protein n=1 Tax=Bifidobacterium tissieri TaxID=1630162 RepID=A0A261FFN8_9BIFI|nr:MULTISPECIES: hypothetical protein [Bifidobacterium]OZG57952.1 hypothetical protein BTIS_1193 [Bifidobacterium tissieri]
MQSTIDQILLWYGDLPSGVQTGITVVVGAVVAMIVFKIVIRFLTGILTAVIAAALSFLLTTVPGHALLQTGVDQVKQRVDTSISEQQRGDFIGGASFLAFSERI